MNMLLVDEIIKRALMEDINNNDIASDSIFSKNDRSVAIAVAKEGGIISGIEVFFRVFQIMNSDFNFESFVKDGDRVTSGTDICAIEGPTREILMAERTALNIIQRMSGISTLSRAYADAVEGSDCKIVDTRKTTPGIRILEKYAVKAGGCYNHRFNLSDTAMIKDNHIRAAGSISRAVKKVKENIGHTVKIEVEVKSREEMIEAFEAGADIIMLDNMNADKIGENVLFFRKSLDSKKKVILEASGNISLENVGAIAATGIDVISCGKLTHSVKALDISLNVVDKY